MNSWYFITERFNLKATLPLFTILWAASLSLSYWEMVPAIVLYISIFIGFFCLRAADDINSIEVDRITHPERGLVSGDINSAKLTQAIWFMIALIMLVNYFWGDVLAIIVIVFYYILFFRFKHKLPLFLKPFLSSLAFGYIAIYTSYVVDSYISSAHVLLGLFIWVSVISHEYAHSIDADNKAQIFAIISLIGYLLACILGSIFWLIAKQPLLFIILLMLSTLYILYLEIQLIKKPSSEQAVKFYINGFLFFLLPCLGLIIDQILM